MFLDQQNEFKRWFFQKEVLAEGSNVLIVDDFMKAGGTVNGMISLLEEFKCTMLRVLLYLVEAEKSRRTFS